MRSLKHRICPKQHRVQTKYRSQNLVLSEVALSSDKKQESGAGFVRSSLRFRQNTGIKG